RGACLATAYVTADILPGVARLATGAWFDPDTPGEPGSLERHGNPNVLTRDAGSSALSQGCSAQTCLVDVAPWTGPELPVRAFEPPAFTTALL
ncbi:MAG TPA: molybdopterin dinucleotide binding domain-containing protein, partial [Quisquiliibacterium sp.]|nr:molybdopterin dinucleotide binding domain-containing protein [Quisquiliibacterium sp.]